MSFYASSNPDEAIGGLISPLSRIGSLFFMLEILIVSSHRYSVSLTKTEEILVLTDECSQTRPL
ncbi:hypothetical protein LIPSTDRAFT_76349 [Lipomyces starkeyi NRRL Y-11557]|uniref:Uncharacterized protein n=1 Tax=Lipomyces starkeyi NRRL Y-11557 TaxID=675824 RepID=A0A1E3PW15_LIPST|nr:hypothetical protein LIPSTDRAFT_76349 [Lipomyces starkeyi NRRL Y-11557]